MATMSMTAPRANTKATKEISLAFGAKPISFVAFLYRASFLTSQFGFWPADRVLKVLSGPLKKETKPANCPNTDSNRDGYCSMALSEATTIA
jgi:hypothetical protein